MFNGFENKVWHSESEFKLEYVNEQQALWFPLMGKSIKIATEPTPIADGANIDPWKSGIYLNATPEGAAALKMFYKDNYANFNNDGMVIAEIGDKVLSVMSIKDMIDNPAEDDFALVYIDKHGDESVKILYSTRLINVSSETEIVRAKEGWQNLDENGNLDFGNSSITFNYPDAGTSPATADFINAFISSTPFESMPAKKSIITLERKADPAPAPAPTPILNGDILNKVYINKNVTPDILAASYTDQGNYPLCIEFAVASSGSRTASITVAPISQATGNAADTGFCIAYVGNEIGAIPIPIYSDKAFSTEIEGNLITFNQGWQNIDSDGGFTLPYSVENPNNEPVKCVYQIYCPTSVFKQIFSLTPFN